jgi:hypothetical protein
MDVYDSRMWQHFKYAVLEVKECGNDESKEEKKQSTTKKIPLLSHHIIWLCSFAATGSNPIRIPLILRVSFSLPFLTSLVICGTKRKT